MEDNKNSGSDVNNDEKDTEQEGVDSTNNDGDNDGEGADGADDKGGKDDGSGDGDDDGGKSDDDKSKDKSDKKDEKTNPDEDEEPKTRKRNIDFILERKDRKIQKLKGKDDKGNDDDTDDGVNPEDEKVIGKVVSKYLNPIIEKQIKEEDEQEIATFLTNNPEFKPYADKVRKFSQHESRKNIPIESIFYEVAGKDLMKIGADKARKADKEAKDSGAGGGNNRGGSDGGSKSVWDMTPEEFEKEQQKVRSTPRE